MRTIRILDGLCWLSLLVLLMVLPLPFGAYNPFYWSFFAAIAATLLCIVLLIRVTDQRADYKQLFAARYILIFWLIQIIYCIWQMTSSGSFFQNLDLGTGLSVPKWFVPQSSMHANSYAGVAWLARSLFTLIVFLLALTTINTQKRIRWTIYAIITSAIFHALIGLLAKLSSLHLVAEQSLDGHYTVLRGLFVNRNHYAAMINYGLAMLSVGGFYALYLQRSILPSLRQRVINLLDTTLPRKLAWSCAVIISLICINLSTSRAAMLGLVVSFFIVVVLATIFDKEFRLNIKWLSIIAACLFGIIIFSGVDGFIGRFEEGLLSIGERREQWRITWKITQKYWLFGTGTGTYADVFQYFRQFGGLRQTVYDQSHSLFLQILMEQGLVGFSFWIASIVAMFYCLFLGFQKNSSRYMKSVILGVSIAVLMALIQSLVDFNLLLPALNVYFYCLLAVGIAAGTVYLPNQKTDVLKNATINTNDAKNNHEK